MIIAAFVRERNEMLLACDVDKAIAFYQKHNPGLRAPPREVVELALHKARTAALDLPREARLASKRWLTERSHKSMDDGTL